MPVTFIDFLESDRSDGKLIVSDAIKAAVGKLIVTNVSEDAHNVTVELENEVGRPAA